MGPLPISAVRTCGPWHPGLGVLTLIPDLRPRGSNPRPARRLEDGLPTGPVCSQPGPCAALWALPRRVLSASWMGPLPIQGLGSLNPIPPRLEGPPPVPATPGPRGPGCAFTVGGGGPSFCGLRAPLRLPSPGPYLGPGCAPLWGLPPHLHEVLRAAMPLGLRVVHLHASPRCLGSLAFGEGPRMISWSLSSPARMGSLTHSCLRRVPYPSPRAPGALGPSRLV